MTSAPASGPDPSRPGVYPGGGMPPDYGATAPVSLTTAAFAGTVFLTVAVFQILEGIAAVARGDVYVTGIEYVFQLDVTTWGWIHIGIGALALIIGIGVLATQMWAYFTGIVVAVVASIANFAFLPYYPLWSLVILAFNIAVIWALCTLIFETRST